MNLFELFVKVGVDDQASKNLAKICGKLGKGLKAAAKIGTAAVGAAAAGITALTKQSVQSYAEFEQLAGGAQLMFGDAYETVMQNARNAFRTVQMSQNEYLQQVNGFAVGLKTALGGNEQAAAELAHRIIQAEADIVAATGNTSENVQNAFNGIMKGNFTMLDNLQIGITPTKEGFQEVIDKVNEWNAAMGKSTDYQMGNLADMQSALVDYIDMVEMSGYAREEAAGTISGSLASVKASWSNLITGMSDENADVSSLMDDFVESTKVAAENLLPTIEQSLEGMGTLVEELAPVIAESLPTLIEEVLPSLLDAAVSLATALVDAIVEALPELGTALLDAVTVLLTDVFGVSEEDANAFADDVKSAFTGISDAFTSLVESAQTEGTWLNEVWTGLQEAGAALGEFLVTAYNIIVVAFQNLVTLAQTDGELLNVVWETIKTAISAAIGIITGIIKVFTAVLQGDWAGAWEAVKSVASTVWDAICSIVMSIVDYIGGFLGTMVEKGSELISKLSEGIQNTFAELFTLVSGWVTDNIVTPIKNMGSDLFAAGKEILNQMWEGLKSVWESIKTWWDGLTFGKKKAEVEYDGPGYATGLNHVPFDGFPAILHRGEAVLTKAEADRWRQQGRVGDSSKFGSGMIVINQYIQTVPQTPVEFANTTEAYFEQARWML